MNAQTNTGRNDYLDYLKGILIFLVVYGHTIQFLVYKYTEAFWYNPSFKFIYIFHMPLFMAVSGFVSYGSMGRNTAIETINKRSLQLIVPIFCWAIIYKSVVIFTSVASGRLETSRAFTLLPGLIFAHAIDSFWFLWSVFISIVIVALLRLIKLDRAVIFAVLCISLLFLPDMYILDDGFRYIFPFFCMGYSLAKRKNDILPLNVSAYWILPGLAVALICYTMWTKESYYYVTGMELTDGNLFNVPFRYISGAAVSAAFLVLTSLMYKYFKSRMLSSLGSASMPIYILQTYFFALTQRFVPIYENRIVLSLTGAPIAAFLIVLFLFYLGSGINRFSLSGKLLLGNFKKRTGPIKHAVADA